MLFGERPQFLRRRLTFQRQPLTIPQFSIRKFERLLPLVQVTSMHTGRISTDIGSGRGAGEPRGGRRSSGKPIAHNDPRVPYLVGVRLVVARCAVDYTGRLNAHLPMATRLLVCKADGSVLVHSDAGGYKPLMWMSPPCTLRQEPNEWTVVNKAGEQLLITIDEVLSEAAHDLGIDPGLQKDGVEAHLQALLAENCGLLGDGFTLVRREFPTDIGPVDLMCRDAVGYIAVEVKRRGEIDGVEQLTRYLERLARDPLLRPVRGLFVAQEIKPQAKVLAAERGIDCLVVDYEVLRGIDNVADRLF